MGANSKIEWTHHTFNPWRGCTKVSAGCKFCYAETMSGRNPRALGVWGPKGSRVVAAETYWRQALKWDREAQEAGERRRVFCASLADVFEDDATMPSDSRQWVWEARERLWELIAATPNLDWLLLTKRPENITSMIPVPWRFHGGEPANVWYGTSVENQKAAYERIPALLYTPARVRFLSCEPLLGPVDLDGWLKVDDYEGAPYHSNPGIHWVIVGGESGGHARPMHPAWARSLRDQCQAAGVAFHFKQHGEWASEAARPGGLLPGSIEPEQCRWLALDGSAVRVGTLDKRPDDVLIYRVGKKAAGRSLDGREWDELPTVEV